MTPAPERAHVPVETPWGITTDRIEHAPGVEGFWVKDQGPVDRLSPELNDRVPVELRAVGGWYVPNDPVPRLFVPGLTSLYECKRAIRTLRRDRAGDYIDARDRMKTGRVRDLDRDGPGPRHRAAIRRLNDDLRRRDRGGRKVMTATLGAHDRDTVFLITQRVKHFTSFTDENDPYGEHDFGSFELDAFGFPKLTINWKIDYYARSVADGYSYGSEAPWDPRATNRVLTIMDASDA